MTSEAWLFLRFFIEMLKSYAVKQHFQEHLTPGSTKEKFKP